MKTPDDLNHVSYILKTISHPSRLAILLAIGDRETCVCHLESMLGWSQSYISQQLMALRQAGLVTTRRERRFIHYKLADPALLSLVRQAAELKALSLPVLQPASECSCSNCCKNPKSE
jgi:ArsR family transcriptional regulator